ncbi:hypothetical protein EYF80_006191 [Liparis tanakae]|uniref:Uncharacterized protein n=1 Tax=Liparis tanakae TaxID=230148 RepID=A0A4Z2J2G9_9TELE|nr:hypothetical protein EYF80_006191 [Liparis tanakae]
MAETVDRLRLGSTRCSTEALWPPGGSVHHANLTAGQTKGEAFIKTPHMLPLCPCISFAIMVYNATISQQ